MQGTHARHPCKGPTTGLTSMANMALGIGICELCVGKGDGGLRGEGDATGGRCRGEGVVVVEAGCGGDDEELTGGGRGGALDDGGASRLLSRGFTRLGGGGSVRLLFRLASTPPGCCVKTIKVTSSAR